jgi:hypothetical protein
VGASAAALAWSDLVSGVLIILFGALALSPRFSSAQWANTAVEIWLLFAPLVFWSPSPAVYANDTLVGALVIAFSILVPMMPGMSHESMMDQSDVQIGWSYCPSTFLQRIPIIALGAIGLFIARELRVRLVFTALHRGRPRSPEVGGHRDGTVTGFHLPSLRHTAAPQPVHAEILSTTAEKTFPALTLPSLKGAS